MISIVSKLFNKNCMENRNETQKEIVQTVQFSMFQKWCSFIVDC